MQTIKQFRLAHNLSQRNLAELLKVNPRTIRYWETGKRNPRPMVYQLLDMLAKTLPPTVQRA